MDEIAKFLSRNNEAIAIIKSEFEELQKIDYDKMLGRERQGEFSFIALLPLIEQVYGFLELLIERGLEQLPKHYLDGIRETIREIKNHLGNFASYKATDPSAATIRTTRANQFTSAHEGWVSKLAGPLLYTAAITDFGQLMIVRLHEGLASVDDREQRFDARVSAIETQAEQALQTIRDQAAQLAVDQTQTQFASVATGHEAASLLWLKTSAVAFGVAFSVTTLAWVLAYFVTPETPQAAISVAASKLVAISMLVYAVVWCGKNYRAHKHNQVLNEHRRNALATFWAFVEGTDSDEVRDAILLQAAQAAFTPRPTGYDNAETDQHPMSHVVELTKSATSRGTGA